MWFTSYWPIIFSIRVSSLKRTILLLKERSPIYWGSHRGCNCMIVGFPSACEISITTKLVSEVYSIQHYMIKFVSYLRQDCGFLKVLRFPPPIKIKICQWLVAGRWFSQGTLISSSNKTNCHDFAEIWLKVALNTINLTQVNNKHSIHYRK